MSLINTTEASIRNAMGVHIGTNMIPNENDNHSDNNMIDVVEPMNNIDNNMDGINHADDDVVVEEELFTYTKHQHMAAKLLKMLDSWNVPHYSFQQMVDWYKEAKELNVTFTEHNKTQESNLKQIRQSIPHGLAAKLLPHTVMVDLVGFTQPVELVRFDLVEMIPVSYTHLTLPTNREV